MDDTSTYLLICGIGFVLTLIVGMILMRSGHAFLRDVFDDDEVATSVTRLLTVLFFLLALGFMALVSTWNPIPVQGTIQLVVTKEGGVMLLLGIMHGATLYLLSRIRARRRAGSIENSMSERIEQQRRARQGGGTGVGNGRTQVIEAGGANTADGS